MNKQSLIDEKRSCKPGKRGRKNKNVILRMMKTVGVPVDELLEVFPGNSFIDFRERRRKISTLRKQINNHS